MYVLKTFDENQANRCIRRIVLPDFTAQLFLFCLRFSNYLNCVILQNLFNSFFHLVHVLRGEPKCWYSVPGSEAGAFEKVSCDSNILKYLLNKIHTIRANFRFLRIYMLQKYLCFVFCCFLL